jgi:hypothetical protein
VKANRRSDREWRRKKEACTFCDDAEFIHYTPGDHSSKLIELIQACPHDQEKIERWARTNGHIIRSKRAISS